MRFLAEVLKKNKAGIAVTFIILIINLAVFLLYDIITEAFIYSSALSLFAWTVYIAVETIKEKKADEQRKYCLSKITTDSSLPPCQSACESDYQSMINALRSELNRIQYDFYQQNQTASDYYTAWAHQIKTPIAVMKLKLSEDTDENRELSAELFRIEQYVDMVLQYIRLGSDTNDLLIRTYSLDEIIKESLRKFAPQFIDKKLRLVYNPTDETVTTDRKWLSCIIDQFISNAVKYTPSGTVTVSVSEGSIVISDTGIGIAPEDVPRVFEKGFTGRNGRIGENSSGLGLYLAASAAELISVRLSVESTQGKGSVFRIRLA